MRKMPVLAGLLAAGPRDLGPCGVKGLQDTSQECQRPEGLRGGALGRHGRLDVVISNAGGGSSAASVRSKSVTDFRNTLELNLIAPFLLTQAALPHLEKAKGNILYISSIAGSQTVNKYSDYCASKAGLDHFARNVASEEAARGIRVNVLSPGVIVTEGQTRGDGSAAAFDKVREGLKNYQPLGRVGEVDDMAKLVAFMISDDNGFMTGSNVTSDGGVCVNFKQSL
eukprot:maker-scaffold422_size175911-snap-gene-0.31 protein:Tk09759 transcript:maker-scaffold422_size175911-snap-gene-0.31-mRNA-1 annotation:"PREDICTED: 3-oxoacyl-"